MERPGVPVVLLALGMIAMLGYMRRIARKTREALAAIEKQVSSQHATLASGIDAIAVEVERLGEGQRFMSKALAGPRRNQRRSPPATFDDLTRPTGLSSARRR